MLHSIVFCLNRAILCDHLVRSLEQHLAGSRNDVTITLLHGATNEGYERGFSILRERFGDRITFVRKHQGLWRTPLTLLLRPRNLYYFIKFPYYRDTSSIFNFKPLLEEVIAQSTSEYVTFLTDDSFFHRGANVAEALSCLAAQNPVHDSFSFRHGLNMGNPPAHMRQERDFIHWEFGSSESDEYWSYRFSIDGHIYRRSFLLPFIRRILYVNPNTFEGVVERFAELGGFLSRGHGFHESVLAGAEINRVQNVSANNNMGINNEMLNDHYLNGFRLKLVTEEPVTEFHPRIRRLSLRNEATGEEISLFENRPCA